MALDSVWEVNAGGRKEWSDEAKIKIFSDEKEFRGYQRQLELMQQLHVIFPNPFEESFRTVNQIN